MLGFLGSLSAEQTPPSTEAPQPNSPESGVLLRPTHPPVFDAQPKSPRDAVGAKVFLTAGGARQRADVFSGGSYGSNSDPRAHFGLGSATRVDKVEIYWPSGTKQEITLPRVDQIFTVDEVKGLK